MWRLINATLILLCLFGRASFLRAQEPQLEKPTASEKLSCSDRMSPAYWENLSYLPVQFINIRKESGTLIGQFASPDILSVNQIEFKLAPEGKDEEDSFFKVSGEWEEKISRRVFLKNFKNDFWVVNYLTINSERVICEAHQFKDWRALEVSYAQGLKNYNVKNEKFWNNLKSTPAYFQEIKGDNAFWIFLVNIGATPIPEYPEPIKLENGAVINKYQRFVDGTSGVVLDHDFFTIDKNCIFHIVEKKDPKLINIPKIKRPQLTLGSYKIRVLLVDREYFVKNAPREPHQPWLCFYEKDFENKKLVLLRAIGPSEDKENGNGKNQNGKNGKNLKQ